MMAPFRHLSFLLTCQTHTSPSHLNALYSCGEGNATAHGSTQYILSALPFPPRWTLSVRVPPTSQQALNRSPCPILSLHQFREAVADGSSFSLDGPAARKPS